MEFEWDEAKDRVNRAKHGLSLADAMRLDWVTGTEVSDDRFVYGEGRVARYAMLGARLHVCIYTWRYTRLRIISLRKANRREIREYGTEKDYPTDR